MEMNNVSTYCKSCHHKIFLEYNYWVHFNQVYHVKAYKSNVICDAVFYGVECPDLVYTVKTKKEVKCSCKDPKP